MSERRERTAEEREAARREREARRAARQGKSAPAQASPPASAQASPQASAQASPQASAPANRPAPAASARSAGASSAPRGDGMFAPARAVPRGESRPMPPAAIPRPAFGGHAGGSPVAVGLDGRDETGDHEHEPFETGGHEIGAFDTGRHELDPGDTSEHELDPMDTRDHELDPVDRGDDEYETPAGIRRVVRTSSGETIDRPPSGDARPKRRRRLGLRVLAGLAVVLAIAFVWFMVELWQPFHGTPGAPVTVTIAKTATAGQIGDQLAQQGVIPSSFFFQVRATLAGDRSKLLAGTYHLRRGSSYGSVLKTLTTPPPPIPTTELTIVEGKSRRQIDTLLHSQGIPGSYRLSTLHSALLDPTAYGAPRSTPSLEGFLYPSTYTLRKPVSIKVLVHKQLQAFKHAFATVNMTYARSKHLTPYDVLIVASIIEKEAATSHDRPLVASVIYNRLKAHMPLGMDSTTRYEFNNYTTPLTASQLAASSPYNTRLHAGLPPTPIGNPGLAAIEAAAHPANTNYYYFVVKPCGNGASVFSSDYQQFLRDSARYQNARAARGGRSPESC